MLARLALLAYLLGVALATVGEPLPAPPPTATIVADSDGADAPDSFAAEVDDDDDGDDALAEGDSDDPRGHALPSIVATLSGPSRGFSLYVHSAALPRSSARDSLFRPPCLTSA